MPAISTHHMMLLDAKLREEFLALLPPLIANKKTPEETAIKNLSRAFSAFVLSAHCGIKANEAASAVVDDFDDKGIDAIYYHGLTETLYFVQTKKKAGEEFKQAEAGDFCQGVGKLLRQDFKGFNKHVQDRQVAIEDALDNCKYIQLIVAYTGSGISHNAQTVINEFFEEEKEEEERLALQIIDYGPARVIEDLRISKAFAAVNDTLKVNRCSKITSPKVTYFGLVALKDLINLHEKYGEVLYEKNIRLFLGKKTPVNTAIQNTLAERPSEFFYLNNGVAALCNHVDPKGRTGNDRDKRLSIKGLSIINGAQTVASAAQFARDNPDADLSDAKVSFTLIQASATDSFGKGVTRARNHQNPVSITDFAALEDEQERLRRELALLNIHYAYKPGELKGRNEASLIHLDEAALALALFHKDPRFVVWLKKDFTSLRDPKSDQYKLLFHDKLTAQELINAVRFSRYIQERMSSEAIVAEGQERLTYRNGAFVLGWVLAQRIRKEQAGAKLLDDGKIRAILSTPFDDLRQTLWDETDKLITSTAKGPLALFRNQSDALTLVETTAISDYKQTTNTVLPTKRNQQASGQPYPIAFFDYIITLAPQISGLTQ